MKSTIIDRTIIGCTDMLGLELLQIIFAILQILFGILQQRKFAIFQI